MLNKLTGLAGAVATLLAIVAPFLTGMDMNFGVVLVILGLIAGIGLSDEGMPKMGLATVALPVAAAALGGLPEFGDKLGGIAMGWGMACAGSFVMGVAIRAVKRAIATFTGLAK